jgi:hypothetical protein
MARFTACSGLLAIGHPANWNAENILRVKDGILGQRRDVIEDDAARELA